MAAPIPRVNGKKTFHILTNNHLLEECHASRTRPTQSRSMKKVVYTVREQLANHPALVKNAVERPFSNAGLEAESRPGAKVTSMIRTVINQSVAKVFQSSAFQTAVETALQKCLADPHAINDVAINTIDATAFTVLKTKFVTNEAEKRPLERAEMEQHRNLSNDASVKQKAWAQDKFLPDNTDSVKSLTPSTDRSNNEMTKPRNTVRLHRLISRKAAITRVRAEREGAGAI